MSRNLFKWGEFLRPSFRTILEEAGVVVQDVRSEADLERAGPRVDALYVRMPNYVSRDLIRSLHNLKVIAVPGAGLEVVDVEGATASVVPVVSGRGLGADAVVEWTILAILWLARDVGRVATILESGSWELRHQVDGRRDVGSLIVGIVGYGEIGRRVTRSLRQGFGATVLATDNDGAARARAAAEGATVVDLPELLTRSDVVTLHTQVKHGDPPVLGRDELRAMSPGGYVVNTGRGQAMDYEALLDALDSDHLGGAAIDVYPQEPPPSAIVDRLIRHPRVLATPHLAGMTEDAVDALATGVARAVVEVLEGGRPEACVNPEVWD